MNFEEHICWCVETLIWISFSMRRESEWESRQGFGHWANDLYQECRSPLHRASDASMRVTLLARQAFHTNLKNEWRRATLQPYTSGWMRSTLRYPHESKIAPAHRHSIAVADLAASMSNPWNYSSIKETPLDQNQQCNCDGNITYSTEHSTWRWTSYRLVCACNPASVK